MARRPETCCIDGCGREANISYLKIPMQVIFITEQTEGRGCGPYLDTKTMDLCAKCMNKIVEWGRYPIASGASGVYTYKIGGSIHENH